MNDVLNDFYKTKITMDDSRGLSVKSKGTPTLKGLKYSFSNSCKYLKM